MMKLFARFDTTSSNAFAREIAEEFTHNFQQGSGVAAAKGSEQRLKHAIEVLGNRAAKFDQQNPLGWFRKARFMSSITEYLREKGHAEELIDRVVYDVVIRMTRR